MDIKEQKAIIEAMLFASGRAVKIDEIIQVLDSRVCHFLIK